MTYIVKQQLLNPWLKEESEYTLGLVGMGKNIDLLTKL